MTKLKWNRQPISSILDTDYYKDPKNGFDKSWHRHQKKTKK